MVLVLLGLASCSKEPSLGLFKELSPSLTGVTFANELHNGTDLNILNYIYYYNGAGITIGDFNNDGWEDIYFVSNQDQDQLYLNQGNLSFTNVMAKTNIRNNNGWTTGVTHVDINHDGLLDIYICKVSGHLGLKGHNLLYVNQGLKNGIPSFKEEAAAYGLAFEGYATQATFFDYDLDGDLDMYLMNHSTAPNANYGSGNQRTLPNPVSGDRLYENKNGVYEDVSHLAGIYQGKTGYGLGLSIGDVNLDGWPDIYVGNDFFENDYLYINNKDRTFTELITKNPSALGHTSHFSMGNAIADYNNDGKPDLFSLDMLPENLQTYKSSGNDYPYTTYANYLNNGYAPQYMQNTLHLNLGANRFSEIAALAGIQATEWSWSVLVADFDNDGLKDSYITNGIPGATNDMDFINFIANDNIQKQLSKGTSNQEMAFIERLPSKKVTNYFFRNKGDLTFENTTQNWSNAKPSYSNGATYADLDNDGDLEIVVNNINENAFILKNLTSEKLGHHYLTVKLKGPEFNPFGVGTRIQAFVDNTHLAMDNYNAKGYLSTTTNTITLGLGNSTEVDSLHVTWPTGEFQVLYNIAADQSITLDFKEAEPSVLPLDAAPMDSPFITLPFLHDDRSSVEFYRDPLVPFANTNQGPMATVADINNDGLQDIFVSGAKQQASALLLQGPEGNFEKKQEATFEQNATAEDISQLFFDANNDGFEDLIVVSGGNEFQSGPNLRPRMYWNREGIFEKDTLNFKHCQTNASTVKTWDFNNDGHKDLIISSDQVPWEFGHTPKQYIFKNNGNETFTEVTGSVATDFDKAGNIKDLAILDLDQNGYQDLVAVGHWMPISIWYNHNGKLQKKEFPGLAKSHGLWNTVELGDFDHDGDMDIIAGNWGTNSKLNASASKPISLYRTDLDDNGTLETMLTYFHGETETPFASKDELTKQIPALNKKYLSYENFAKAPINELLPKEKRQKALHKSVYELRSAFFENTGKDFVIRPLPHLAQVSNVFDILVEDINNEYHFVLVGNNFEISTQLGRMDASHGIILQTSHDDLSTVKDMQTLGVPGASRSISHIRIADDQGYLVSRNNDSLIFISKRNHQ